VVVRIFVLGVFLRLGDAAVAVGCSGCVLRHCRSGDDGDGIRITARGTRHTGIMSGRRIDTPAERHALAAPDLRLISFDAGLLRCREISFLRLRRITRCTHLSATRI